MVKTHNLTLKSFSPIEILEAKIEDVDDLVSCINTGVHYPPYWTERELKWWIFECPLPVITYRAIYKEETVGTFMIFRRQLTNNLNCGVLMGLVVKKEWRGKGLFKLLGKRAMEYFKDIDLLVCFPNINGAKALEKNFNFKTIARIETLILEKNKIKRKKVESYSIQRIDSTTKFKKHQSQNKYLMFKNDKIFRQWRYGLNPLFSYYIVSNQSKNFSIVKVFDNKEQGKKIGDIVDFEMEYMEKNSFFDLMISTCSALTTFDVDAITIKALPNNLIYEVAKKIGFKESNNHNFCVKRGRTKSETIYNPLSWIIRWGDFMRR